MDMGEVWVGVRVRVMVRVRLWVRVRVRVRIGVMVRASRCFCSPPKCDRRKIAVKIPVVLHLRRGGAGLWSGPCRWGVVVVGTLCGCRSAVVGAWRTEGGGGKVAVEGWRWEVGGGRVAVEGWRRKGGG